MVINGKVIFFLGFNIQMTITIMYLSGQTNNLNFDYPSNYF